MYECVVLLFILKPLLIFFHIWKNYQRMLALHCSYNYVTQSDYIDKCGAQTVHVFRMVSIDFGNYFNVQIRTGSICFFIQKHLEPILFHSSHCIILLAMRGFTVTQSSN